MSRAKIIYTVLLTLPAGSPHLYAWPRALQLHRPPEAHPWADSLPLLFAVDTARVVPGYCPLMEGSLAGLCQLGRKGAAGNGSIFVEAAASGEPVKVMMVAWTA